MIETLRAVAHPWLCDAMGHLNVRHYVGMFDDASWHLLADLGHGPSDITATRIGWADVRHVIEYKDEVASNGLVRIRSEVIKLGRTSLTYRHEMLSAQGAVLHATMEVVTVAFDLDARKAVEIPALVRERAPGMMPL